MLIIDAMLLNRLDDSLARRTLTINLQEDLNDNPVAKTERAWPSDSV